MTTLAADEIERIVKAVMAEVGRMASTAPSPPAAAAIPVVTENKFDNKFESKPENTPAKGDLVVDARLVTMSEVADKWTDARRLLVSQSALVTPAVLDELRRRNVTLVRGAATAARQGNLPGVLVVSGRTRQSADGVIRLLEQEHIAVRHMESECMIESTDALASAVGDGQTLGLLWTRLAPMGLCLANRHAGVRAVCAGDVAATAAAIESVGANVLVLEPTLGTEFQRKQLLREFCRGGVRRCPDSLASRLG